MDPVTALGVAAAAVGFFDCALGLFKDWGEIRSQGQTLTLEAVEKTTKDLVVWKATLYGQAKLVDIAESKLEENDLALQRLLEDCAAIAQKLADRLESLKPTPGSMFARLQQAVKTMLAADDLQKLREQLLEYRSQIVLRVLSLLNGKMNTISGQQNVRFDQLDQTSHEIVSILARNRRDLDNQINSQFNHVTRLLDEQRRDSIRQNRGIIEAILTMSNGDVRSILLEKREGTEPSQSVDKFLGSEGVVGLVREVEGGMPHLAIAKNGYLHSTVLSHLGFRSRKDRFEEVKEAHKGTFQWIFSRDCRHAWSDFPKWLEEGHGCYWINGKAGSGKSTLMKFISNNEQTQIHLEKWTGNSRLLTASFFFWYLGTSLQKSKEGLLRSLLYDVLSWRPDLIPKVMPDLYSDVFKLGSYLSEPTIAELMRWFKDLVNIIDSDNSSCKICFFIDGLDEYIGDHLDLNRFFLEFSFSQNIKFVLSSRPITACTDAFSGLPSLRLQDITQDDIRRYTEDSLKSRFKQAHGQTWDKILQDIVEKACGVFLWVHLVVKSLLEGLRDGDSLAELKQRLDELPSDLKDLYRHMLERIPDKYRRQSSEIFLIVLLNLLVVDNEEATPFSAFELSLALESEQTVLDAPMKKFSNSEVIKRIVRMDTRVRSRCLGLLEVHNVPSATLPHLRLIRQDYSKSRVTLIHRSAVEFLQETEVQATLFKFMDKNDFNPYEGLFKSCLMIAKSSVISSEVNDQKNYNLWIQLGCSLDLAREAEILDMPIKVAYIMELDKVFTIHWRTARQYLPPDNVSELAKREHPAFPCDGHWIRLLLWKLDMKTDGTIFMRNDSLLFYTRVSEVLIPRHTMSNSPHLFLREEKLGIYRAAIDCSLASFIRGSICPTLAQPSSHIDIEEATALLGYLIYLVNSFDSNEMPNPSLWKKWNEICDTLLAAGANPNAKIYGMCQGIPCLASAGPGTTLRP